MQKYAWVKVGIGEANEELTKIPPEHLESFSYSRSNRGVSNLVNITVYDKTALEIEDMLIGSDYLLTFSYGWYEGKESPRFKCFITTYDMSFNEQGATLSITAISLAAKHHSKPRTKTWVDGGGNPLSPSEIITEMAEENEDWVAGDIEETMDLEVKEGEEELELTQENISDTKFIQEKLMPQSLSNEKEYAGYSLSFEDSLEGTKINYVPTDYDQQPVDSYIYEWRQRDSRVIDFSHDYDGFAMIASGGNKVVTETVDTDSNDMIYSEADIDVNPDFVNAERKSYGDTGQFQILNSSSGYQEEVDRYTRSVYRDYNLKTYPANLTIIGDPELEPLRTIEVHVFLMGGHRHKTSGIYYIESIEDSISGGFMESKLTLSRNTSLEGERSPAGPKAGE